MLDKKRTRPIVKGIAIFVLDTTLGLPAKGVEVVLEGQFGELWQKIASGTTNELGCIDIHADHKPLPTGRYRLVYETERYFQRQQLTSLYPRIQIDFNIAEESERIVLPLLFSAYGYTTYRGS